MSSMILLSFLFFMLVFAGVGLSSVMVKKDTTDDYLVAGRGMHPALAALSAVSTWNSGYMFIGFIGFTYMMGYSVIWLAFISTLGQILAWVWLYKFIQKEGQERGVRSLSSLVAEKAGAPEAKLAAAFTVLFLSIYAAAQLTSGGKALYVMMGWSEMVGILIGFVLVVAYCYAGGIRASIWTDAAQSCVMIVGSVLLCWIALGEVGGFSGMDTGLEAQNTALTNWLPPGLMFGISLWAFAFFLGGLGVAGQPQVVSRIMTLGSDSDRKQAMIWFFVWQTPFIVLMLIIGLVSRVLFTASDFDAELGLPEMAMSTMPAIGVGMILASIFAATMSTADSQVLACTAAITDDIKPEWNQDHKTTKKVTLVVAAFATMISIGGLYIPGGDSVFLLVVLAVYGLGGIFIPLLTIRWMGYKPDSTHSITMMLAAFGGVIIWSILGFGGSDGIFPSIPGMGAAFVVHFILNQVRTPELSPLGRFNLPEPKKLRAVAVAIIIPFGAFEVAYLVAAPDSSDTMSGFGTYTVNETFSFHEIGSGSEFIEDGETVTVGAHSDVNSSLDDLNIIAFSWWTRQTEQEVDCTPLPDGEPGAPDNVSVSGGINDNTTFYTHEEHETAVSSDYSFLPYLIKLNPDGTISWKLAEDRFENISSTDLHEMLDGGDAGFGEYSFDISVIVNRGGQGVEPFACENSDDGELVDWSLSLVSMEYTFEMVDE